LKLLSLKLNELETKLFSASEFNPPGKSSIIVFDALIILIELFILL